MASRDEALNQFVFGLWKTLFKKAGDEGWSAVAALEGCSDVPALFDKVYSQVANPSETNLERKSLVRFV
jgi:hypothetical protein